MDGHGRVELAAVAGRLARVVAGAPHHRGNGVVPDERFPRARGSPPPRRARAIPAVARRRGTRGRTARGARRRPAVRTRQAPVWFARLDALSRVIAKGLLTGPSARASSVRVRTAPRCDPRWPGCGRGPPLARALPSNRCANRVCSRRYSSTFARRRIGVARTTSPCSASKSGKRPDSTARRAIWIVLAGSLPQPSGHGTCTWR